MSLKKWITAIIWVVPSIYLLNFSLMAPGYIKLLTVPIAIIGILGLCALLGYLQEIFNIK